MSLPNMHRNHEIEELSERYFRQNLPISWVVNKFVKDYGTDYNCEISKDRKVTGKNFTVQLKGKEKDAGKKYITIKNIKRNTINRWFNRLEPTMIIVYLVVEEEAFWCWLEYDTVDLSKPNRTFQIKVPRKNRLSKINWSEIID